MSGSPRATSTISRGTTRRSYLALWLSLSALFAPGLIPGIGEADPLDVNWSADFGAPGLEGEVRAAITWNSTLVAAGSITHAGGSPVQNVVSWNGIEFVQMGAGLNAPVTSLAVVGAILYAAGDFTASGGTPLPHVARWTGSAWAPVGTGAPDVTGNLSLAVDGSSLLLLGEFSSVGSPPVAVERIALWNGGTWSSVGGFSANGSGPLRAAARVGGLLYVGGGYRESSSLHAWDGSNWTYDIGGIDGEVYSLAAIGTDLYVHGEFTSVDSGNSPANQIARWDGAAFASLDNVSPDGAIHRIGVDSGQLFVVGTFINNPGPLCAYWDGSSWTAGPARLSGYLNAFARAGGDLFLGGQINGFYDYASGGIIRGASEIVAWNGSEFRAVGPGFGISDGGYVYALETYGGALIAAGNMNRIGRAGNVNGIAAWDGTQWSKLGPGLSEPFGNPSGDKLANWNNRLVVSGYFTGAGVVASANIIAWNGSTWEGFAGGISGQGVQVVDYGSQLIVAGLLGTEFGSGTTLGHVARWTGSQWQTIGTMAPAFGASATKSIVWNGKLVCGGLFSSMNGVAATNIAQWDGANWSALAGGLNGLVTALAVHDGALYASGNFTASGATPLPGSMARWNGGAWAAVGSGLDYAADAMTSVGSELFVSGNFGLAGGSSAMRIGSWNGTNWSALGSGMGQGIGGNDRGANDLVFYAGDLFAGGFFNTAGDKSSRSVARWHLGGSASVDQTVQPAVDSGLRMSFLSRNPARDQVSLILRLPAPANISADVCDAGGRRVRTLESGRFVTESYRIRWDGRDDAGRHVGAGVFWVRVTTEKEQVSRKVVWVQ